MARPDSRLGSCSGEDQSLLAIDTSTRYAGVGLWKGERLISALSWYSHRNHTAELMPAIEHVLGQAGVGAVSLGGIAVALGPGGFSALRVGISVAQGLALSLSVSVCGVGTLEMEAYSYAGTGLPICSLLDSSRGEVAAALFQNSRGRWRKLEEERICSPEELLRTVSRRTLFCGEGVPPRSEYLRDALGRKGVIVDSYTPASRLWALGSLARERMKEGDADSLSALQPLYLRSPSIGRPKTPQKVKF